ncbi:ATP12 family chaperone protein [Rhodobium gokarnense]|uniref:Chaperone required for assembly of F1-ATPase n=1 Tax=Rhodobium gokarnense TaxID=364296 RepID=A0ABT3HID7_9HYPH|nr:ATP12 family protein [Rhodobium gokarnense]MCW2310165.1 chaperone required for assembly of F1-ATPase [Rhodobium gokarnense]
MRDLFDLPQHGEDPVEKARAHARRDLPKRFYKEAAAVAEGDGHAVVLDGRPIRTPAGSRLVVPHGAIAAAIAAEWAAQETVIDPGKMPLTRLANSALDAVAREADAVRGEIARYAGGDLLIYRAGNPQELVERQNALWNPVIAWAEGRYAGRFTLAEGVMHVDQNAEVLTAIRDSLAPVDPLPLAALHVATTLTGSALLALSVWHGELSGADAWQAAHVDEDWNMQLWGRDEEALERRAHRAAEFEAAVLVIDALRPGKGGE